MRVIPILLTGAAMIWGTALPAATANADDDVATILEDCQTCHGKDGASTHEEIPVIGGMSAFYIEEQLRAYQEKRRPCGEIEYPAGPEKGEKGDMCKEVKDLNEDQVAEIAAYFADKPFVVPEQEPDAALAGKGKSVHETNCRKCHTEGGGLAFDDAGILAGQWRAYLNQAFKEYRSGDRWMPEKMKPKIDELSDADIEALVEFYASQEPAE